MAKALHDRRGDIEGLRAISVLVVVLYHAHIAGFSGGFVGVDVFFVISGFLITRILLNEVVPTGTVSLTRFWLRRAVRLLPNASLTLAATLIAGYWLIPVYDHPDMVKDVLAAAFYVSNFRFASSAVDYFRVNDTHSPVMNFWSLSVEEQYYIVFPLMLLVLMRFVSNREAGIKGMLWLIWVGSFALSIVLVKVHHTQAFFNTAARAWELATGALLAAYYNQLILLPKNARLMMGWLGLAAVIGSIVLLKDGMMLPGFWVLLPVLGCAAIIAANGESQSLNGMLDHVPFRWLGARSYSLYLWHWPIFTFVPLILGASVTATIIMIALAVLISWATYEWVENPIRMTFNLKHEVRRPVTHMSGLVASVVAIATLVLVLPAFLPKPANQGIADELVRAGKDTNALVDAHCFVTYYATDLMQCRFGAKDGAKTVVVLGDSHAAMWFSAFDEGAQQAGWAMEMHAKAVCPAADITTWKRDDRTAHKACDIWRQKAIAQILAQKPDLVLLTSLNQLSGDIIDRNTGAILTGDAAKAEWQRGLEASLKRLTDAGLKVAVLRDIPQARGDYRQCLMAKPDPAICERQSVEALDKISPEARAVRAFDGVQMLDWSDLFCQGGICRIMEGPRLIYRDNHHVTDSFAQTQAGRFTQFLKNL